MMFDVLHQLRVKGRAPVDALAEATGMGVQTTTGMLEGLAGEGLVEQRVGRMPGWTLTAAGRHEAARLLAGERGHRDGIEAGYRRFLTLNEPFKDVCTAWQVRDLDAMVLNDHADVAYDTSVVDRLGAIHDRALATVSDLAAASPRFGRYGPRLSAAYGRVRGGDHRWLTTPLIGSYHDVWMELHEDLLLTLGIERREGIA